MNETAPASIFFVDNKVYAAWGWITVTGITDYGDGALIWQDASQQASFAAP
jgi:hypothetical protein